MVDTLVLAHRGSSKVAPENTESAFRKALEIGADGVEFDVHLTKDKKLVVIHDERVDRTTNDIGYVKDLTLKEIKKLDAGSYFSPKFAGEKILTLEETFEIVKNFKLINIEIKNNIIEYDGIEEIIIDKIRKNKLANKIICSSFNHYSIYRIKEIAPDIKTGLLYGSYIYQPWVYAKRLGVNAIHPYYYSISSDIVKLCHDNKIEVNVWTVDDEEIIVKMIQNHVDAIITNFPDMALELLNKNRVI